MQHKSKSGSTPLMIWILVRRDTCRLAQEGKWRGGWMVEWMVVGLASIVIFPTIRIGIGHELQAEQ